MKIAIVILNYNSSVDCRKCIGFLQRQEGIETEIVVVDNCSRSDDRNAVETLCAESGATFIASADNRGYNAGNNIGLRYAANKGYRYALIANPDMEFPQTDYIKKLVDKMEHDETIAICASDIINSDGRHQNPQREATYNEELFWFMEILRNRKSKKWYLSDYAKSGYCEKVSGCCFLLRMCFAESIGFFDENVFLYCEESILAKQVACANFKVYYLSSACAVHFHIEKLKGNSSKRLQLTVRSRYYYLQKYSGYKHIKLWILLLSKQLQRIIYKLLCFKS